MADISRISRLINNLHRELDLTTNTLVLENVKLNLGGANTLTFGGTLTGNRTITVPDKSFTLSDSSTFRLPGKTYFLDRDAENLAKIDLYNDGGATPTDGVGGSPINLTKALNVSTPIVGLSSYRVSKDAVNRQGQGWSITTDVALDAPVVAGEPITVQFRYRTSANYASGDIVMFAYLVGPNTLIPLNGISSLGVFGNSLQKEESARGQFTASLNATSGTTAIRIIGHIASGSNLAYDLDIDEITIGTAATLTAPIVTDWIPYTPTVSNLGTGGLATNQAWYKRSGDNMELRFVFTKDGSAGTGGSVVTLTLPSGFTINTNKVRSAALDQNLVGGFHRQASTAVNQILIASTNAFYFRKNDGTAFVGSEFPASNWFSGYATIPISQWENSSNVISSTQANFITPAFRASRNGVDQTGINTNLTTVKLNFNSLGGANFDFQRGLVYDTANSRFVCVEPGLYEFHASGTFVGANILANRYAMRILRNGGSGVNTGTIARPAAGETFSCEVFCRMNLSVGDIVEAAILGYGNNSVNTYSMDGGPGSSSFSGRKVPDLSVVGLLGALATRYQEKTLASDVTSIGTTETTITGLTLNNLIVGRRYRVSWRGYATSTSSSAQGTARIVHNSIVIGQQRFADSSTGSSKEISFDMSKIFLAGSTTVTFTFRGDVGTWSVPADITNGRQIVTLEELPNISVTTEWT